MTTRHPCPWSLAGAILALAVLASMAVASAQATITRDEALRSAYPGAEFRPERVFLTDEQRGKAAALAGVQLPSSLVARYHAVQGGTVVGRAYVDTHTVRTKRETLLVSLDPGGHVRRIDVTAFLEPPEYEAPDAWMRQYRDRALGDDLQLQRAIRPLAGATLTARATNEAVRRVLAIDRVLSEAGR